MNGLAHGVHAKKKFIRDKCKIRYVGKKTIKTHKYKKAGLAAAHIKDLDVQ